MRSDIRWQAEHVDWRPLEGVIDPDHLPEWMWMHTITSPETGADVHFYKHISSRRYVRLDREGRVYAETADGEPRLLPPVPAEGTATVRRYPQPLWSVYDRPGTAGRLLA